MSELVLKGFLGGHLPTKGYYSGGIGPLVETLLSELESYTGIAPLLRVRFDLNGDGEFEIIELDKVMSVGNLTRAVEYIFNRPRFSSCQARLANYDLRFSDNYPHAYTHLDPANPDRYFMRPVIVELGFDNLNKHNDAKWVPLFFGYIVDKKEDAEGRSVTFGFMDEWTFLLQYTLSPYVTADKFITYETYSDSRSIRLGTYYGRHLFLVREYANKDNQLLIPCCVNINGAAKGGTSQTVYDRYKLWTPQALNLSRIKSRITLDNIEVYFWMWNKDWDTDTQSKQWAKLLPTLDGDPVYTVTDKGEIVFLIDADTPVQFETVRTNIIEKSLNEYFNQYAQDWEPHIRISMLTGEQNPVRILYDILRHVVGFPLYLIDASNDDPTQWVAADLDYDNTQYYSFDVSSHYLDLQQATICVRAEKGETVLDLINDLCSLTRGSFFTDKGKEIVNGVPTRRIHFVIHQPRLSPVTLKVLDGSRLSGPMLSRNTNDIRNIVNVGSFAYSEFQSLFTDLDQYTVQSNDSVQVYGPRNEEILFRPGSLTFLDNCLSYARFLGDHILMLYKEPPLVLSFNSGLVGLHFDLKSLMGIRELSALLMDFTPTNNTGVYEVYGLNFNTSGFRIQFEARWAGYLVSPTGSPDKKWGFWNHFTYGGEDGYYW